MNARNWHRFPRPCRRAAEGWAQIILKDDMLSELLAIPTITRESSYNMNHATQPDNNPVWKEQIAMFGKTYHAVGKILDCGVPLDNFSGTIGMMAYADNTLTLLELNPRSSGLYPEHAPGKLLRAALKIFTYWKTVDHNKLLADFNLPPDTIIAKAVLLFENSDAYNEYANRTSPNIIALMKRLDVGVFGIKAFGDNYEVFLPNDHHNPPVKRPDGAMKDYIRGGIMGAVVGDALGVPVEFSKRSELRANPVVDMREYGEHNQPKGTWSDDSSLLLCLAESLVNGLNYHDICERFLNFLDNGYMTPHGETFDVGIATKNAIRQYAGGTPPLQCGGGNEMDNGNGSLMRILPIAFYAATIPKNERLEVIHDISKLTHSHNRSLVL